MPYIDMHCDSLMQLFYEDPQNANLYESTVTAVDFSRMKKGAVMAQFFAIFVIPRDRYEMHRIAPISDEEYIQTLYQYFCRNIDAHSDLVAKAHNAAQVLENWQNGKMSAILTLEDGRTVDGQMEHLKRYYDLGVRALNLTWNAPNCFGHPNSTNPDIMQKGLTDFGKQAVDYMQELGMLIDVSHLSDGGFYDVANRCQKPFIASHSNARALSPHPRNLTDDMIHTLGNHGGVAGLNFGREFLNQNIQCIDSTADLIAKHALYIKQKGGIECVAIGTDFDGIEGNLELDDCTKLEYLTTALEHNGFTAAEIEKICYQNILRVMTDAMK